VSGRLEEFDGAPRKRKRLLDGLPRICLDSEIGELKIC
jgi:hypothetical protein